ncbi:MAG: cobalt transporter CbiM [Anaerolineae bacterium]|nr:cobalt transporter CbiM [Anaerolineae bacterium]
MHIPDGILPLSVAAAGYVTTGGLTWFSLRRIRQTVDDVQAQVPKAALLTAAFFIASWIHIPVPPTSVHLILNGLLGVVLGFYAIPAILIGLFLQAVMFQHGGLTTLGVNTTMMGLPALLAYFIFQLRLPLGKQNDRLWTGIFGFLAGGIGLGAAAALAFFILVSTIPANIDVAQERTAITALILGHVPLMFIEGTLTAMLVTFLQRVRPELIGSTAEKPVAEPAEPLPVAGGK